MIANTFSKRLTLLHDIVHMPVLLQYSYQGKNVIEHFKSILFKNKQSHFKKTNIFAVL